MATTSTWSITYPTTANNITPLATHFANLATSVDTALTRSGIARVASAAARNALFPSPTLGDRVFRTDVPAEDFYTGSAWRLWNSGWITYTPTTTLTVGTGGTSYARYKYENGRVRVKVKWTFGAPGGAIAGGLTFTLPVPREALDHPYQASGELANYFDASPVSDIRLNVVADNTSTTQAALFVGIPAVGTVVNATNPVAIGVGDTIVAEFTYDPA